MSQRDHAVDIRISGQPLAREMIGDAVSHRRRTVHCRQDAQVVARRHAAVLADDALKSCRRHDTVDGLHVGTERVVSVEASHLQIVQMHVLAGGDVARSEADDLVVTADGRA